jgi:hypothetical protein
MPTTVSTQRGSVTFTARADVNTNITTLFTNGSSGISTRVIVNYLVVQNPFIANQSGLTRRPSASGYLGVVNGSASTLLGVMNYNSQSDNAGYMNVSMPIQDPGVAYGQSSTGGFLIPTVVNQSITTNQVGFLNQNPGNMGIQFGGTTNYGYCPRNFWIGPSDQVRWWPRDSSYVVASGKTATTFYITQTLFYSFTLITES